MQKGVFIDLVLIRASGGVLTDEGSIQRNDIRHYMPAAINYTVTQGYYTGIKTEGNRDISSLFYGYFPALPILKDATKDNRTYTALPKGTIALPSNQGIRFVTDSCENTYKPLSDNAMHTIKHYLNIFPDIKFYRLEKDKIYLYNTPSLAKFINLTIIVRVEDLDDTDELPIPAGLEDSVIDLCVQFVTGERQLPADRNDNKRDIN